MYIEQRSDIIRFIPSSIIINFEVFHSRRARNSTYHGQLRFASDGAASLGKWCIYRLNIADLAVHAYLIGGFKLC